MMQKEDFNLPKLFWSLEIGTWNLKIKAPSYFQRNDAWLQFVPDKG